MSKSTAVHFRATYPWLPPGLAIGQCFARSSFITARKALYPSTTDPSAVTCRRCLRLIAAAATSAPQPKEPPNAPLTCHLPWTLHGIPCGIHITAATPAREGYLDGPPGDCFPPQDAEWFYLLLDRHGYPAGWLERMLTPADRAAIDDALSASLAESRAGADLY